MPPPLGPPAGSPATHGGVAQRSPKPPPAEPAVPTVAARDQPRAVWLGGAFGLKRALPRSTNPTRWRSSTESNAGSNSLNEASAGVESAWYGLAGRSSLARHTTDSGRGDDDGAM